MQNQSVRQAHPPQVEVEVEVEKDAFEKGKYQHPELYGQPKEMGVDYDLRAERSKAIHANSKANPRAKK